MHRTHCLQPCAARGFSCRGTPRQAYRCVTHAPIHLRDVYCCSASHEAQPDTASYRDILFQIRRNEWEGAEEAFSLLKRATVAVTPANEDLRTTLRSLVGAIASQADALSTGSLIETLSLLATWRLLSDNTALSLVSDISNRLESDQDDESLVRSCAAAMVQLRSNFDGTDAHQVAEASVAGIHSSFVFDSGLAEADAQVPSEIDPTELPRSVPGQLQSAAQQVCVQLVESSQSYSCSYSAKTVVRVMWCCCHWGLQPRQLLAQLTDESQLAAEVESFDCRDLTAAAWTCGVLQDTRQHCLLECVAEQASSYVPITGVEHSFSLNQCSTIAWSLGRCQLHHKSFWTQLSREFPVLFSDTIKAPSSIVVRLLWGMAAARFRHVRVLSEVVNWLDSGRRLRLCSPTELSRIIWSFSALNFSPGHRVLQQLHVLLAKSLQDGTLDSSDALVSATALASFRSVPGELLADLAALSAQALDCCTTEQIVRFLRLLASSKTPSGPFFDAAAAIIVERLPNVRPEQMLTAITSFQRLSAPLRELLPAASSFTQQHISLLQPSKVAEFLSALANDECEIDSIHEALVQSIIYHLPNLPRGSLSDVAWASATLKLQDDALLAPLEARAVQDAAQHSCTSVCTIVWAFAKLGWCCDEYLSAVHLRLAGFLKHPTVMQPKDVAILLWSFAEMNHKPNQRMMSKLHKAAVYLLPQQDSQSLSLTLVAFNKLQRRPIQLVDALPTQSDAQILSFEPLHIANLLYSLASSRFSPDPGYVLDMVTAAELQADLFKTEEWANLTWALAKFTQGKLSALRKTARDALVRLVPDILPSVEICSGHDCSRLLWAYRRAEIPAARCQELLSAVIMRCARLNAELSARDCATVLWAAGHYRALHDFPILPTCEIAKALEGRVHELEVEGLTACLTGLSSLRLRPHGLMSELEHACAEAVRASKCKLSELALLMSSFAQLGHAALELCNAVLERDQRLATQRYLDVQSRVMLVWATWSLPMQSGTALCAQQEQALYKLAPSHGISDTALVQIFQVCSVQSGLKGETFLPQRCTVFRRSTMAFERLLHAARGSNSDKNPDHNLMVASQELLADASEVLTIWGVAHEVVQPHDATQRSQPLLPHLLCTEDVPDALRDGMYALRDMQLLSCEGQGPRRTPKVGPRCNRFRIVVIPDEWIVESIPALNDDKHLSASDLTGFARFELLRTTWAAPNTFLIRPSRFANIEPSPSDLRQSAAA